MTIDDILKLLLGGIGGAVATGGAKFLGEVLSGQRSRLVLINGIAAEIKVRRTNLMKELKSDEDRLFMAPDGLPYEFYSHNKSNIGIIGSAEAGPVISYYSYLWQVYRAGDTIREMKKSGNNVDNAMRRLAEMLKAAKEAADDALEALPPKDLPPPPAREPAPPSGTSRP